LERLASQLVGQMLAAATPRVAALYRLNRRGRLDLLLSAKDFAALLWRARALGTLVKSELSALGDVNRAVAFQQSALTQLARIEKAAEARSAAARQESLLAQARAQEMTDLLSYLGAESSRHRRVVAELTHADKQLARLVEELASTPSSGLGFGKVVNPRFNTVTVQNGMDIRAPMGALVRAVASGKVVYAGWLRGYGNLLILDHGGGFHSLMAHLEGFARGVGGQVGQGEEVGRVGDTASLKGPYLYFEIRHRGQPVDPALWLTAARPKP
jgi:septal ring factor EnvC (AmiA/AmiB activator)